MSTTAAVLLWFSNLVSLCESVYPVNPYRQVGRDCLSHTTLNYLKNKHINYKEKPAHLKEPFSHLYLLIDIMHGTSAPVSQWETLDLWNWPICLRLTPPHLSMGLP